MKDLTFIVQTARSLNGIDCDLIDQAANIKGNLRIRRRKRAAFASACTGVAACLILVAGVALLGGDSGGPLTPPPVVVGVEETLVSSETSAVTRNTPEAAVPPVGYIPEFVGLPANDFCLSEIEARSEIAACRIWAAATLSDFFRNPNFIPEAFVLVRVVENDRQNRSNERWDWIEQTSTLQVLSSVRTDGVAPPEIFTLQQTTSGYRTSVGGPTALLREGGVYLLPLWLAPEDWEWEHRWYSMSDLDVLFEVDDKGLIWSHSPFEGLNKYDGRPASELAQAIVAITEDADFEVATSMFGMSAHHGDLAEITVLSMTAFTNEWDITYYVYDVELMNGDVIAVTAYVEGLFEIGERYLAMLHDDYTVFGFGPYFHSNGDVARVNADRTFTPFRDIDRGWSLFGEFDGYTVEQMVDAAQRSAAFYERY
jgi:hypothetical protein